MLLKFRRKKTIIFALAVLFTNIFLWINSSITQKHVTAGLQSVLEATDNIGSAFGLKRDPKGYYKDVVSALKRYSPGDPPHDLSILKDSERCEIRDVNTRTTEDEKIQSYENLNSCYRIPEQLLGQLSAQHTSYVNYILSNLTPTKSLFQLLYPNERGIVTVGGARYTILALTMIRALRERGTTLPVEVFIPTSDGSEDEFCKLIETMNGRCFNELSMYGAPNTMLKSYQNKAVALLASSFKEIIFIDADNIPLMNLDNVFDSVPYKENGLILWPDIWNRMTSPSFYELAGISVNFTRRARFYSDDVNPPNMFTALDLDDIEQYNKEKVPFHDLEGTVPNYTSESGQIIVNKRTHLNTLLLALYYNIYGNEWFYKMFSQGTSGEGDKETFILAAHALAMPYYQVKRPIEFDGYVKDFYRGVGLLQHDFVEDYKRWQEAKQDVQSKIDELNKFKPDYSLDKDFLEKYINPPDKKDIDIMFVHASYHKFVPNDLLNEKVYIGDDGKQFRSFNNLHRIDNFDIELFAFQGLQKYLCTDNRIRFHHVEAKIGDDKKKYDEMCDYINDRVEMLKNTHDEATSKQK
ncbi:HDL408Wp [Eremothecium sinecaudum]|uniref:HDL408Wp n=1 Tax=Eremothecium sinecaudum TaxID=45286 RepID=A0A0X8HQW9_9SACH|nr:HDL408Wp [Eremothecium sinecaudum]AMD20336.1 HDL408Wp [Eremothecium sinecaudum]